MSPPRRGRAGMPHALAVGAWLLAGTAWAQGTPGAGAGGTSVVHGSAAAAAGTSRAPGASGEPGAGANTRGSNATQALPGDRAEAASGASVDGASTTPGGPGTGGPLDEGVGRQGYLLGGAATGIDMPAPPRLAPLTEPARDAPYGAASAIVPAPDLDRLAAARAVLLGPDVNRPEVMGRLFTYQQAKSLALALRDETPMEQRRRAAAIAQAESILAQIAQAGVPPDTVAAVDRALAIGDAG